MFEPAASKVDDSAAACLLQSSECIQAYTLPSAGMAHGLVFLPVLLSLVGPGEINVGAPAVKEAAVQEAQPAAAAKGGVAMGSVASEVVNEA